MNDRASLEEEILVEALALPVDTRRAFIQRRCGTQDDSASRLFSLLDGFQNNSAYLETPAAAAVLQGAGRVFADLPAEPKAGDRIGRYRILSLIGEGGFGVVHLAEQEEPVRRLVALKVIRLGLDTREFIRRFELERQALAMMDHPNIARVFDAGATESGRPYLVMELVRGIPITTFCDEHRLPIGARLELFLHVCGAIQHAHQKGVIHCDLKPSNILIGLDDSPAAGCPKVIDFGIARATADRPGDRTIFTRFYALVGTPAYTSPEQMALSGLDVDTRSDIYALGVLLYELLTGCQPFERELLENASLEEMRRLIREVDPPRPSQRISALADVERARIAGVRGISPDRLAPQLRSDLDWIVMRCLEKDRTRRYETANGLAMDLRRHLANEPVVARPPSRTYQFRKFVRRHRPWVIAGTTIAIALVAGLTLATTGFARARIQQHAAESSRREAEDLVSFMVRDLKPELQRVGRMPLTSQVAEKAVRYFANLPPDLNNAATERNRAVALEALAEVRVASGLTESARSLWREALAARRRAAAAAPTDPLIAVELALTEFVDVSQCPPMVFLQAWGTAGPPELDARLASIVDRARAMQHNHRDNHEVTRVLGRLLTDQCAYLTANSRPPELALAMGREAEGLYRDLLLGNETDSGFGPEFVRLLTVVSAAAQQAGRSDDAIKIIEEAVSFADNELAKNPGNTELREIAAYAQMQRCYRLSTVSMERSIAAEAIARERFSVLVQMDPQNISYQHQFAEAHFMEGFHLLATGQTAEGRTALQRFAALMAPVAQSPTDLQSLRAATVRLAALVAQAGDGAKAREQLAAAQEWHRKYLASLAPDIASKSGERLGFLSETCSALGVLGDWKGVEPEARALVDATAEARRADPHDPNLLLQSFEGGYWLGRSLLRQGRADEAVSVLQRLVESSDELAGVRLPSVDMNAAILQLNDLFAEALIASGDIARARVLIEADFAAWEQTAVAQPDLCSDINLARSACLLASMLDQADAIESTRRTALIARASFALERFPAEMSASAIVTELSAKLAALRTPIHPPSDEGGSDLRQPP